MKTLSRTFSILSLAGLLFAGTGCVRESVVTTTSAAAGPVAKLTPKSIPSSSPKMLRTPEQAFLQDMNLASRKSHEIFTEVWAHIWSDRMQRPMSVFSEIGRTISAHMDAATGTYQLKSNRCHDTVPRASEIVLEKSGEAITGAVFYRLACKTGESAREEMARVSLKKSGAHQRAEWTYYAEHMPRGAGSSLAFLRERIRCAMNIEGRNRLDSLECQNIGQNRDNEMHMRFDRFNYKRDSDTLVLVEGKKYKLLTTPVCDEPKFCTQMKVPLVGQIDLFDDVVSEEAKQNQKRLAREEEIREAQADLEKRIKEQQLAAAQQALDLKKRAERMQVEAERVGTGMGVVPEGVGPEGIAPSPVAVEDALPGEPFAGADGQIVPASPDYAPTYEAPQSIEDDPAAQTSVPHESEATGTYEFTNDPQNAGPQIERQATEGLIR